MKKRVLIIDDDKAICKTVQQFLEKTGEYEVRMENKGAEAFSVAKDFKPDIILLDLMLPGMNGFEICKTLKENDNFAKIPIIMMSARSGEPEKVSGLDLGADDYIAKPVALSELSARIRAVLRRQEQAEEGIRISIGKDLTIDLQRHEVEANGNRIELTPAEFKILELLSSRKNQVFSRDRILEHLWGEEKGVLERTIDVHIRHLREKLGKAGDLIKNIRGIGYKLEIE